MTATALVVDASVAVAWFSKTQATHAASSVMMDIKSGCTLVVPALWAFEVANSLLHLRKRGVLQSAEFDNAVAFFEQVPASYDSENLTHAFGSTSRLAARHNLTVYDAAYLELAERLQLPLASRDKDLLNAATAIGLQVIDAR